MMTFIFVSLAKHFKELELHAIGSPHKQTNFMNHILKENVFLVVVDKYFFHQQLYLQNLLDCIVASQNMQGHYN